MVANIDLIYQALNPSKARVANDAEREDLFRYLVSNTRLNCGEICRTVGQWITVFDHYFAQWTEFDGRLMNVPFPGGKLHHFGWQTGELFELNDVEFEWYSCK